MLTLTPPAQRVTLVSGIGVGSDGDSLAGQNVNNFPDGALFFCADTKRTYMLQKNLPVTVVAGNANGNVVAGIGSDHTAGFFVACLQADTFILSGGTLTQIGWSLPVGQNYDFLVSLITPGGTPGFPHAARATDHSVTLTSTQDADTGTYLVVLIPTITT